jgi:4'-phosphopantetheinyl transferase
MVTGPWQKTPASLEISSNAIDIWRVPLNPTARQTDQFFDCLSKREQKRAQQFRFPDKRIQFVTTRARLRQCLALAIDTQETEIQIETGASGKPVLCGATDIQFNVSHTHGLALIAITRGQSIGIDVERLRDSTNHLRLAENYFSAAERTAIISLPKESLVAPFFACWTRKEAVVKAIGTGVAHGLDSFDVSTDPEIPQCQTRLHSEDGSVHTWCPIKRGLPRFDIGFRPDLTDRLCTPLS